MLLRRFGYSMLSVLTQQVRFAFIARLRSQRDKFIGVAVRNNGHVKTYKTILI